MNKHKKAYALLLIAAMMIFSLAACQNKVKKEGLWENATYTKDTTFGNGAKTLNVSVEAGDDSVTFTIKTDKATVGDALLEYGLIDGDTGAYGLYVKVVNGITADYDIDQSYWSFNKGGEMMPVGVDGAEFADGDSFELVYSR